MFMHLMKKGKRCEWGYTCCDMEAALHRKDELLKKYPQVIVRDNATRKEKSFKQNGKERRMESVAYKAAATAEKGKVLHYENQFYDTRIEDYKTVLIKEKER